MSAWQEHPDLLGLVRGEVGNAEVADAGAHLERCETCRRELGDVVVGHAMLTAAARLLDVPAPRAHADGPTGDHLGAQPPAAAAVRPHHATSRRRGRWAGAVAAAALVVAGSVLGLVRPWESDPGSRPVAGPPARTAVLVPVAGAGRGSVRMAETSDEVAMQVTTRDLPPVHQGQFYYAWLLDPATQKMLPLGVVGPSGTASFTLPASLLGRYGTVDVSLEKDDGDPGHSVRSVLQGSYA